MSSMSGDEGEQNVIRHQAESGYYQVLLRVRRQGGDCMWIAVWRQALLEGDVAPAPLGDLDGKRD